MANISTLGQIVDNNARLKTIQSQLYDLQSQLASGKKARFFDDLGPDALGSQRFRADINQISTYQTNITVGTARIKQTIQTIQEFRQQAQNVADTMGFQLQQGEIDLTLVKDFARSALTYVRDLMNVQDNDRYLLSGSDSLNPPINDTGSHATYMQSLTRDWINSTISTDQLIDSYKTTPETTMGYSPALSSGLARNVYIRADVNIDVEYTVFGNNEGFKDVLNTLSLIDNLDLDKIALGDNDNPLTTVTAPGATSDDQTENFFSLFEDLVKTINGGLDKLEVAEQKLQKVEVKLNDINNLHKTDNGLMESALSDIEDADVTDAAVKLNALQIQLTAAYQVTARLGELSLARFI